MFKGIQRGPKRWKGSRPYQKVHVRSISTNGKSDGKSMLRLRWTYIEAYKVDIDE